MKTLVAILKRIAWLKLFCLSFLMPRNRRLWAFGSWHGTRFADNTKWLFLHATEHHKNDIRAVWVTKNPKVYDLVRSLGHECCMANSWKGICTALRAGVYIYDAQVDDISFALSGGARRANLWHGIALKTIERDITLASHPRWQLFHGSFFQKMSERFRSPWTALRPHMVAATSPETARVFSSAFGIERSRTPLTGYPRNDALLMDQLPADGSDGTFLTTVEDLKELGEKTVCYMPTFRDGRKPGEGLPIDWNKLSRMLSEQGAWFLLKLHPHDVSALPDLAGLPRILVVPPGMDAYPLLRRVDVLVTDYSSVYFDFLLLDRPVVFYCYDLAQYMSRDRSLYYRYDDVTPGERAQTQESLIAAIRTALVTGPAVWQEERERARALFHSHRDAASSERAYEAIQDLASR